MYRHKNYLQNTYKKQNKFNKNKIYIFTKARAQKLSSEQKQIQVDPPPKDEMNEPDYRYVGKRSTKIILQNNEKKKMNINCKNFLAKQPIFRHFLQTVHVIPIIKNLIFLAIHQIKFPPNFTIFHRFYGTDYFRSVAGLTGFRAVFLEVSWWAKLSSK